jgi:hypothetical protein
MKLILEIVDKYYRFLDAQINIESASNEESALEIEDEIYYDDYNQSVLVLSHKEKIE